MPVTSFWTHARCKKLKFSEMALSFAVKVKLSKFVCISLCKIMVGTTHAPRVWPLCGVSNLDLNITSRDMTRRVWPWSGNFVFPKLWWSARVYRPLYFDFTATLFTVCIQGLGTTVNIFSSLCKHFQFWANFYRPSAFELNLIFSAE